MNETPHTSQNSPCHALGDSIEANGRHTWRSLLNLLGCLPERSQHVPTLLREFWCLLQVTSLSGRRLVLRHSMHSIIPVHLLVGKLDCGQMRVPLLTNIAEWHHATCLGMCLSMCPSPTSIVPWEGISYPILLPNKMEAHHPTPKYHPPFHLWRDLDKTLHTHGYNRGQISWLQWQVSPFNFVI